MNVTPISYNYSNIKNNSVKKHNTTVSFSGGKTVMVEKAKENAGCAINVLFAVALAPLALLSEIFTNKNDEIVRMTYGLKNEYEGHHGNFKSFDIKTNEMNKFLNKHTKNEEYAQFVKEAISFLRTNFEQNVYEEDRMEPFNGYNLYESQAKWLDFMETIQNAAKAAVAKNYKDIDIEKLNKDIQTSREIMQK